MRLRLLLLAAVAALAGCAGSSAPPAGVVVHSPTPEDHAAGWASPAAVPGARAAALSDGFASAAALGRWGYLEGDYGHNRFTVRHGQLEVTPPRGAWVDSHRAFYLYRRVRGDFDVRARIRVTGRDRPMPARNWSLSGLLVRRSPAAHAPENWVALRVGAVDGARRFEHKTTVDGRSRLALDPAPRGWVQLRVVRRGSRFRLLTRPDDGAWRTRAVYDRSDLPGVLEVGIDAFSGFADTAADLTSHVDWIRFAR